VRGATKNLKS